MKRTSVRDTRSAFPNINNGQLGLFLSAAGCLALLTGCAGNDLPIMSVAGSNTELSEGYSIAAGDKLRVTIFDEPTLSGEFEIGLKGDLAFPLIGSLDARGKTSKMIASSIADGLREGGYVIAPRVSIEVLQHRPFFILGEVTKPGEYPYVGDLTLEQAVAKAGGFTARADKRRVILRRQDWVSARMITLDGAVLQIGPGDTITVKEAFF